METDYLKPLKGKVAMVTGASRGLGRAIALAMGNAGADVAVTDLLIEGEIYDREELGSYSFLAGHFYGTDAVKTRATTEQIKTAGSRSIALKIDVTDREEVDRGISAIEKELGQVNILVNNAALMDNFGKFENQESGRWEKSLQVNLTGAFNCAKAVWPSMVKKRWGRIINISSVVAFMGAWLQPSYGTTKAGLLGLTKSLAIEGGKYEITVNAVCPGFIETEAVKLYDNETLDRIRKLSVLRRLGTPQEIAEVVVFLSTPAASYITGAAIPVTGGTDLLAF
ncbi:MAG: SDR family oxidoreductase [Syntrophales bacterium]|jgi:3-oxoacyl-[acyl-carrier protein] reductase